MNYQAFTNDSLTMMYEGVRGALSRPPAFSLDRSHRYDASGRAAALTQKLMAADRKPTFGSVSDFPPSRG
jgi:hypothetical protein